MKTKENAAPNIWIPSEEQLDFNFYYLIIDNGVIFKNELIVKSGNVITMKRPCVNDLVKILRGE